MVTERAPLRHKSHLVASEKIARDVLDDIMDACGVVLS
jgi:hypothetical protein